MAYGEFNFLPRRLVSNKVLRDRTLNMLKNPKYDAYQCRLASIVHKFSSESRLVLLLTQGQELIFRTNNESKKWHKAFIGKLLKGKVYLSGKINIWGADLDNMQFISKYDKEIRFLLCVIDVFRKYVWAVDLKGKKGITVTDALKKI